jgi:hypothetical protein
MLSETYELIAMKSIQEGVWEVRLNNCRAFDLSGCRAESDEIDIMIAESIIIAAEVVLGCRSSGVIRRDTMKNTMFSLKGEDLIKAYKRGGRKS